MSSTHAKTLRGSFSPPNYNHQQPENTTGFGKQKLSRNTNVPAYGFGSQPRLQFKTSMTPVSRLRLCANILSSAMPHAPVTFRRQGAIAHTFDCM